MRSFILIAAMIIGTFIAPSGGDTMPDGVAKFFAYALIVGFVMDLIELFK